MSQSMETPQFRSSTWRRLMDLYGFLTNFEGAIHKRYRALGPIFRFSPLVETHCLLGGDANRFVLVNQAKSLSARLAWEANIGVLFRGGLLNRDGADHRNTRRLLMPAFRQEALNRYLELAEPIIDQHVREWPADCKDIYPKVKELTLDITNRVFFGIHSREDLKVYSLYMSDLVAGSIAINKIPYVGRTYHKALKARAALAEMLHVLVEQKRKVPASDMMGQLCQSRDEDGQLMSADDIIDQMIFIMMAAHDTTASTLASLFYELAAHPQWQENLHREVKEIRAANIPITEQPDRFELVHYVIKETLRRNTPLKVIPRTATEDLNYQGTSIPRGAKIILVPAFSHFMKEYWSEPQNFDPLRFSPARQEHKNHPFALVAFGGGAHSCLGQFFAEKFLSVIVGKVVESYSWTVPDISKRRFQQVPIQVPKGRLPVRLRQREPVARGSQLTALDVGSRADHLVKSLSQPILTRSKNQEH